MASQLGRHHSSNLGDLDYLLFVPREYREDGAPVWPLLLFLHGRGESGSDLDLIKQHGVPKVIAEAEDFPCITVSPQCPVDRDWVSLTTPLMSLLNEVIEKYNVDRRRIYLTGLSMGGRGTWALAVEHPEVFAALAPICGRIPDILEFMEKLKVLKDIPIWVFHGAKDPTVPVEDSELIVAKLRSYQGNVRYTVYPDAEHDSWTETYNNPELYSWILSQSLSGTAPATS